MKSHETRPQQKPGPILTRIPRTSACEITPKSNLPRDANGSADTSELGRAPAASGWAAEGYHDRLVRAMQLPWVDR
jgi:hypothetical protein